MTPSPVGFVADCLSARPRVPEEGTDRDAFYAWQHRRPLFTRERLATETFSVLSSQNTAAPAAQRRGGTP